MECQFNICDELGTPLIKLSSNITGPKDIHTITSNNSFECRIDELPLVPGNYQINVAIRAHGILQDHVISAAHFQVESGNLGGRFIPQPSGSAKVCTAHSWIIPIPE